MQPLTGTTSWRILVTNIFLQYSKDDLGHTKKMERKKENDLGNIFQKSSYGQKQDTVFIYLFLVDIYNFH